MSESFLSSPNTHVTHCTPCSLVPKCRTSAFIGIEDQTASERQGLRQLDQDTLNSNDAPACCCFRARCCPLIKSITAAGNNGLLMAHRSRLCSRSQTRDNGFTKGLRMIRRFTSDAKHLQPSESRTTLQGILYKERFSSAFTPALTECEEKESFKQAVNEIVLPSIC